MFLLNIFISGSKTPTPTEHYARAFHERLGALSAKPTTTTTTAAMPQERSKSRFPADQLRAYVRPLLAKTLVTAQWDSVDRARMGAYSKEICERVKQKMLELEPKGYKYIVTSQFSENFGQAGRADMSCHWEDSDCAVQEMFSNESLTCVVIAYAVRAL